MKTQTAFTALRQQASLLTMIERTARIGSWRLTLPEQFLRPSAECAAILNLPPDAPLTLDTLG